MFTKILIANRGEIACRVIATARRLGVQTVAVFSDADANAKHVMMADEAFHIGAAPVSESYLQADRIITAAIDSGAQAIHPGYGFLSENPGFVRSVEKAGLVFIGPSTAAIEAMGLKDAAKQLMFDAGVPVVPGYHGISQDPDTLAAEAESIGYPVLIKARAGGGGKGMRLVENPSDFRDNLEAARREGEASFGDPVCLIEKYIVKPRHIEIQVFGDNHGNVVHLFERDCSLQRRHQKVIEEAPAPDMPEGVRRAMGRAAVEAAKTIAYSGAGTIEFIVDGSEGLREDGFWFMEMNTRLQVEHPVSEAITGLDFVELQLRVAAGEPLPFEQADLEINGWAFEARVYAEDVPKGFLPAIGVIDHLSYPEDCAEFERGSVRVDSGVRQGDEISPFYDPMIAKVVVHGPTRASALNLLTMALSQTHVGGSVTNIDFLSALSTHSGFAIGEVDTDLIARDIDRLAMPPEPNEAVTALAAIASLGLLHEKTNVRDTLWSEYQGWRHWSPSPYTLHLLSGDVKLSRQVSILGQNHYLAASEGSSLELKVDHVAGSRYSFQHNGSRDTVNLVIHRTRVFAFYKGQSFTFEIPDFLATEAELHGGGDAVIAPMPGTVTVLSAQPGQVVSAGDTLVVLEAMKMEHSLVAPRDGVVGDVTCKAGDQVVDGDLLIQMEAEDSLAL